MVVLGVSASACSGSGSGSDGDGSAISAIEVVDAEDAIGESADGDAGPGEDAEVAAEPGGGGGDGGGSASEGAASDGGPGDGAESGSGSADEVEVDVTVVPEEITPEYVEAVLAELELLYMEALREMMVAGEPTIEVTDRLGSAFSEPQYQARLEEFLNILSNEPDLLAEPEDLRPRVHQVVEVLAVDTECIYVETIADGSGITRDDLPVVSAFVLLGPVDVERPGRRSNTPWLIHSLPLGEAEDLRSDTPCTG